jgi:hypothetical protein
MTSYLVSFFDEENGDLVSSFGIEASSTLDMLYNILSQEWEQGGILMIHEDDMDDIFENFLIQILREDPIEDWGFHIFKLKEFCKLGLSISKFLKDSAKDLSPDKMLDIFCSVIKDAFEEQSWEGYTFEYEIEEK